MADIFQQCRAALILRTIDMDDPAVQRLASRLDEYDAADSAVDRARIISWAMEISLEALLDDRNYNPVMKLFEGRSSEEQRGDA